MMLVVMMSMSAFADVTITKEWEDGLTGTAASNRAAPTVNLEGTTPYEQLLNLMYPVGSVYLSMDMSFNPNVAWGGTWQKLPAGMNVIQAGGSFQFGTTGGATTHKHKYGISLGGYYGATGFEGSTDTGVLEGGETPVGWNSAFVTTTFSGNNAWATATKSVSMARYKSIANTEEKSNMPPYIAGNIWKRVA